MIKKNNKIIIRINIRRNKTLKNLKSIKVFQRHNLKIIIIMMMILQLMIIVVIFQLIKIKKILKKQNYKKKH